MKRYLFCLLLFVGCEERPSYQRPLNPTAGPHPAYQVSIHPCEANADLPFYEVREHDGMFGFGHYTTRAVRQDDEGNWQYWFCGEWLKAHDRRTQWDKEHGYGHWIEIILFEEEKRVFPKENQ